MVGKREKKRNGPRLPAALLVLAATVVLLTSGGPLGVAADSPAERPAEQEAPETAAWELTEQAEAAGAPEPGADAAPVAGMDAAPAPGADTPPAPEPKKAPFEPVAESAPVEDTYFDDVVFLGDSRTEGFSLYSGLRTGTYLYAVGATVESVFSKDAWETAAGKVPLLDALAGTECGKVYVMLGVNELGWNKVETFRNQYAKVIDRIREDHPDAEVVIQSLLPVSAGQEAKGSYVNNERIAVYNEQLLELAEEKDCAFLNVAEAVVDEDGCLREDWTFDGVHLNVPGCQAWLEYLRTHPVGEPAESAGETE